LERLQELWYERSGTSEILALKESVGEASLAFDKASAEVTHARRHLDDCLRNWERTSGQHLQLLQRRESWTPEDAQQFADLVSKEIVSRNAMEQAREDLAHAEESLSKRQLEYMNRIRRRYHEEQIWQDQWRVLGTYGTWSLIVLNSCVFLASQYFLRIRENQRMKAIEQLIHDTVGYNNNNSSTAATISVENPKEVTVSAAGISSSAASSAAVFEEEKESMEKEELVRLSNAEVEHEEELLNEEVDEVVREAKVQQAAKTHHQATQLDFDWPELQAKVKQKLTQIRNDVQSKTNKIIAAVPGLEEMPKSASEVHVPSAILGSVVTGSALILFMVLLPGKQNR